MSMDDETYARLLQQQLLEEEIQQQQAQAQAQALQQQPPQQNNAQIYQQPGAQQPDPYQQYQQPQTQYQQPPTQYQQPPNQQLADPFYPQSQGQRQPDSFQSQQHNTASRIDDEEYARRLMQGYQSGETPHQPPNPSGDNGQAFPPSSACARLPPPEENEDSDLALARRMQQLETMGMGLLNSQTYGEQAAGALKDSVSPGGKTKKEQEEEDQRLAILMAQSGQSLRDLDPNEVKRKDISTSVLLEPTHVAQPENSRSSSVPDLDSRKKPPQYSDPEPNRKPPPQFPPQAPSGQLKPPPQYSQTPQAQLKPPPNYSEAPPTQVNPPPIRPNSEQRVEAIGRPLDEGIQTSNGLVGHRDRPSLVARQHSADSDHAAGPVRVPPRNLSAGPTVSPMRSRGSDYDQAAEPIRVPSRNMSAGPTSSPKSPPMQQLPDASPNPTLTQQFNQRSSTNPTPTPPTQQLNQRPVPGRPVNPPRMTGPPANQPSMSNMNSIVSGDVLLDVPAPVKEKKKDKKEKKKEEKKEKEKKKKRGFFGFGRRNDKKDRTGDDKSGQEPNQPDRMQNDGVSITGTSNTFTNRDSTSSQGNPIVPFPIPEPVIRPPDTIGARPGPLPYSLSISKNVSLPEATVGRSRQLALLNSGACAVCQRPAPNALNALDKKYHNECFRCITCQEQIDPTGAFAYVEHNDDKQPMHRRCYAELYGIKCAVCKLSIPAGPDGKVSFVKHPFFDTEQMCPHHARNMTRRCTGCHRFEPENEPFADLNDVGRCVCLSCCRTVIVDSTDAQPLWSKVVSFFENKLNLPIWQDFRNVPILIVGYNALNDQMTNTFNNHGGASQIMTRGLCLTEHESGRRFKMNRMKFDKNNQSFVACDAEARGFTYFQVPDANKVNPDASVTAILCLSGLPKDLTASVLAHEATHAWIKLHPRFEIERPIPPAVEEGVAQLIALLFLNDGLDPAPPLVNNDGTGPSDGKLRQYFRFSIETDDHEIYGSGYRRAAIAYSKIGIEALMSHIVLYQDFPTT